MTHLRGTDRLQAAQAARARYEQGDTIRGIAAATGWSYGYVRGLLVDAKTTLRPRGFQKTH